MAKSLTKPAISVVMPVHNAMPYLQRAVSGVLRQTFRDIELIAIDDGSTDGSLDVLRRAARGDHRVRVVNREKRGVVETRNECVSLACGEYIAVNDADDVSAPRRLEKQLKFLLKHPEVVAVGSRMRFIDPFGHSLGEYFTLTNHEAIQDNHVLGKGSALGHSSVVMRCAAVRSVGGYRSGYDPAEDLDLWLRLGQVGRLANLPECLVDYRLHSSSLSHAQAYKQRLNALRAVNDARRTMGQPSLDFSVQDSDESPVEVRWMREALASKAYTSAFAYGMRSLFRQPCRRLSWRLFAMGLLGPNVPAVMPIARQMRL